MICWAITLACSQCNPINDGGKIEDVRRVDINVTESGKDISLTKLIEDFYYVPLQGLNYTSVVGKVIVRNHKIYVEDENRGLVTVYDLKGKELFRVDNHGDGPGEFNGIQAFTVDTKTDELLIYDRRYNLVKYTANGEYVGSFKFKFALVDMAFFNGGRMMVFDGYSSRGHKETYYAINEIEIGVEGIRSSWMPYSEREQKSTYLARSYFSSDGSDAILFTDQFSASVYEFSIPSKDEPVGISTIYGLDFGKESLPKDQIISPSKDPVSLNKYYFLSGCSYKTDQSIYFEIGKGTNRYRLWKGLKPGVPDMFKSTFLLDNLFFNWTTGKIVGAYEGYFVMVNDGVSIYESIQFYRDYLNKYFPEKVGGFEDLLSQQGLDEIDMNSEPVLTFFKFKE
ncbi:6-bladed beta-propeller protein [Marinoscillum furvescens DSM 4134]|uniref:6-bladed beta-propeller protein n=2 Tax=Marinoscillum furvescens TaxID=1026 RepID=A0A3D9L200_MARFU|nr:6-bladed beta-propeller protein [Marinoscillum furvescens DSM 4134]